jgi:hypothetical protein
MRDIVPADYYRCRRRCYFVLVVPRLVLVSTRSALFVSKTTNSKQQPKQKRKNGHCTPARLCTVSARIIGPSHFLCGRCEESLNGGGTEAVDDDENDKKRERERVVENTLSTRTTHQDGLDVLLATFHEQFFVCLSSLSTGLVGCWWRRKNNNNHHGRSDHSSHLASFPGNLINASMIISIIPFEKAEQWPTSWRTASVR